MARFKNVKGIIFRTYNAKDKDKVIHLIDTKGAKHSLFIKGVRGGKSKKAHSIEIGNFINAKIVEGYALPILSDVQLINEFQILKKEYLTSMVLQSLCEVIASFVYDEYEQTELFDLLLNTLQVLDKKNARYLFSIFLLKILEISGHAPHELQYETKVAEPNKKYSDNQSKRIIKTQKFIMHTDIQNALRVNLSPDEEYEMIQLHIALVENIIERELKSKSILLQLVKEQK